MLREPDTGEARYVGQSAQPAVRIHHHCIAPGKGRNPRTIWLYDLKRRGLRPVGDIIIWATDPDPYERFVIRTLRESGAPLLNIEDGGRYNHPMHDTPAALEAHSACIRAGYFGEAERLRRHLRYARTKAPHLLERIDRQCAAILPPYTARRLGYKVDLPL